MTEDKTLVECIRLHKFWRNSCGDLDNGPFILADRIEQLTAEVERLQTKLAELNDSDVIARTMADNERLREALQSVLDLQFGAEGYAKVIARAALEDKQ